MKQNKLSAILLIGLMMPMFGQAAESEFAQRRTERVRVRTCLSQTHVLDLPADPAKVRGIDIVSVSSNDRLNSPKYVLESLARCYANLRYPSFELGVAQERLALRFVQNHPATVLTVMQIEESVLLSRGFETKVEQE